MVQQLQNLVVLLNRQIYIVVILIVDPGPNTPSMFPLAADLSGLTT
ncbi:hypothetical protein FOTG_18686 [Fusarium oxysporum f. sp. vasinfectum 25433]|uniref:Uncharacterized protein n=1 Tax=Fusarium oxysporum f. sp. vasinfectum 25433 TaxID=1089449 RepID=X0KH91_FUSOX|nr:hypothetical protein FOTG_18686 [Fusarium oxysporum f. sp. vasinfectum 25433]